MGLAICVKIFRSKLSVEVTACKHGIGDDGRAFLLLMDCRVNNSGNRSTTITGLEAHFVDPLNNLQSQTLTLSVDVGARASNFPLNALFSFTPSIPDTRNLLVHFILYHTFGREVFVANSVQLNL
jgi:hypothetical protein